MTVFLDETREIDIHKFNVPKAVYDSFFAQDKAPAYNSYKKKNNTFYTGHLKLFTWVYTKVTSLIDQNRYVVIFFNSLF